MCLQNMLRSTGYVKTKNGQVPVLVSGVRTRGVKGHYVMNQNFVMNIIIYLYAHFLLMKETYIWQKYLLSLIYTR